MFWGFVFTASALVIMILWALLQIKRVDSVIEQVDREQRKNEGQARHRS